MKSLANDLLKVAAAVCKDVQLAYPTDKLGLSRDLERLTQLVEKRGLGVFTLDLPALDDLLLSGLENSRLILCGALSKRASRRILVPRLFKGLWLRIFDVSGNLRKSVDVNSVLFLRQLCCLGKKLRVECSQERKLIALEEYINVEKESKRPTLDWEGNSPFTESSVSGICLSDFASCGTGDPILPFKEMRKVERTSEKTLSLLRALQQNADMFSLAIGNYDPLAFSDDKHQSCNGIGLKHGPGAVADKPQKGFKYDFPSWSAKLASHFGFEAFGLGLPVRPNQAEMARQGHLYTPVESSQCEAPSTFLEVRGNRLLGGSVEQRQSSSGCKPELDQHCDTVILPCLEWSSRDYENYSHRLEMRLSRVPSRNEPASRLLAVPKTAKGPRLIAAESTAHQWCQQLTKQWISDRLSGLFSDNFICFKRQDLSKALVAKASRDRSLATVDLSSASDRLTCAVVERVFRRNISLLNALHSHRTRWCTTDIKTFGRVEHLKLKMFASQGTATTFPIQSIIFLLIALTASGFRARSPEDFVCNNSICNAIGRLRNRVRVYGDDIIIPTTGYDSLVDLLHTLGLKVNDRKSFRHGNFRESCGSDCFNGVDVTPIKPKSIRATGPQSRQALLDTANLFFKAGFWHASEAITSTLPKWMLKSLPVVGRDCGVSGLFSFCGTSIDHLQKRYSERYHRYEIRYFGVKSKATRIQVDSPGALIQNFSERPSADIVWSSGVHSRPKTSDGLRWEPVYPFN